MGYKAPAKSVSISITVRLITVSVSSEISRGLSCNVAFFYKVYIFKMFRRTQYGCFLLVVGILLICAFGTEAQLNFSTGWGGGKRSQIPQTGGGSSMCSSQGKPSLNQLLALYNLIQTEAQKILDCQKLTK